MALPPDPSDSAPFTKHKKKKKKSRLEEKNKVNEKGDEERTQGDKEKTQGRNDVKKKKRRHEQMMESEEMRAKEREEGNEEVTTKKKKRKGNGIQPEEASQGDEATRKKKKRKENGIQPKVITIDEEMRKKKEREQKKEEIHLHDMSQAELDLGISSSELLEIEEFIPDVRLKSLVVKQKLKRVDLPRFREFKRKGLKLRWGQFSQEENLQIRRNVEDFLKLSGIQTSEELFYPCRFPDRQLHLKGVRASHHFYSRIADGLLRTCEQVYICARKMFDEHTIKGKFSEAEVTALKKLHMIYGNNWKIIGDKLDRSIYACQRRYSVTLGDRGKWTEEETRQLKAAALKHLERVLKSSPNPDSGPSFIQLCTKIPWGKIVKKVDTRSWIQCRYKWFGYLRSRMKAVEPKIIPGAAINTRIRLIQALYELQVEEVSDVDWIEVAKTVGHVTPMCVQKLFHRLKVSRIPSWTQSSFGDIVDHLFEKELPQLQNKLQSVPPSHPVQVYFSLKQLFPPEEHEEFMELDNT